MILRHKFIQFLRHLQVQATQLHPDFYSVFLSIETPQVKEHDIMMYGVRNLTALKDVVGVNTEVGKTES